MANNTTETFVGLDVADLSTFDGYRLLTACVGPRPIALTSTVSADGVPNLAPFSFFMAGGADPLSVIVSPLTNRDGSPKHTLRNVRETGEFTINVVTYTIREPMNDASAEFPYGVSEWDHVAFTAAPAVKVRPARVAESPMAMECRLFQIVEHGAGALSANYIIGEVVYFHIRADLLRDGAIDSTRVDYIARLNGDWYARADADAMFELARPARPEMG